MYEEIIKLIENNEFDKALAQIEKLQQNDPKKYNLTGHEKYKKRELDKAKKKKKKAEETGDFSEFLSEKIKQGRYLDKK